MSSISQLCLLFLVAAIVLAGIETRSNNASRPQQGRVAKETAISKTGHRSRRTVRKTKTSLTRAGNRHARMVGQRMHLGTKGKWTIVHFWATWCHACKDVTPELAKLHKKYSPLGVDFMGVNLDSNRGDMTDYMTSSKINWPQVVTMDGWQSPIRIEYDVPSIPAIYLVNPKGVVVEAGIRDFADGNNRILHHLSR